MLEQPLGLSHTRMHISGSAQPTVFGYRTRLVVWLFCFSKKFSFNLNYFEIYDFSRNRYRLFTVSLTFGKSW